MIPDLIGLKSKLIAGGIALAIVASIIGIEEFRINDLSNRIDKKNTRIDQLTGDLAVANANLAVLKVQIERQNTAIDELKAQKARLDAAARKAALDAQKNRTVSISTQGSGVDSMNQFFERLFK